MLPGPTFPRMDSLRSRRIGCKTIQVENDSNPRNASKARPPNEKGSPRLGSSAEGGEGTNCTDGEKYSRSRMRAEGQIKNGGLPNLSSATSPHPAPCTPLPVLSYQKMAGPTILSPATFPKSAIRSPKSFFSYQKMADFPICRPPPSRTPLPVFSHQKCGAHDFAPHLPDHPDNPELPDHPRFKGHQILKFPFSPPSLQILLHALFHFSLIFSIILPLIL